jgi:hypothetical protein
VRTKSAPLKTPSKPPNIIFDGNSLERIKLASIWLKELERLCPGQKAADLLMALMAMRLKELLDKP